MPPSCCEGEPPSRVGSGGRRGRWGRWARRSGRETSPEDGRRREEEEGGAVHLSVSERHAR